MEKNNYIEFNSRALLPEEYFKEFLRFWENSEVSNTIREKYKLYLYGYPTFEHVTFNGRMLGEAIRSVPEILNHIETGGKIKILAHSMGGLVARSFIEEHGIGYSKLSGYFDGAGDLAGEFVYEKSVIDIIDQLVTLATPHHGSPAAINEWIEDISDLAFFAQKTVILPVQKI